SGISRSQGSCVYDRRISEGTVRILQSRAADLYGGREGVLDGSSAYVQNQVLVAQLLDGCGGVVELVDVCSAYAQDYACLCGKLAHSLVVGSVSAVQDRLLVLAY